MVVNYERAFQLVNATRGQCRGREANSEVTHMEDNWDDVFGRQSAIMDSRLMFYSQAMCT